VPGASELSASDFASLDIEPVAAELLLRNQKLRGE